MTKRKKDPGGADELRCRAEERTGKEPAGPRLSGEGEDARLLHELKIHKIELEMQNQELRESRNALEEALERYTDLYEFAPVGYFTLSPEGSIARVNLAGATLLKAERPALVNRRLELFLAPDSRPAFRAFLKAIFPGRARASCEAALAPGQPPARFVSFHGAVEAGGRECRVAMTDITERKRAEEAMRQALEDSRSTARQLSAMFEAARTVLTVEDFPAAARHILDSAAALIGSTAGYVALLSADGQRSEALFLEPGERPCAMDPKLPMPVRGLLAEACATNAVVRDNDFAHSRRMTHMPGGHARLDNVMFAPLVVDGVTAGVLGLANKPGGFTAGDAGIAKAFGDLAAIALRNSRVLERLIQSEQAQKEAAGAAQAANRAKSEFLANMSHEIRTPLNGVLGMLQLMVSTPLDREQKEFIDIATESSKRLTRLLSDILDLARVEAKKLVIRAEPFNLREALRSVEHLFRPAARQKGLEFRCHVDPAIPQHLLGDATRLQQILNNLVGNAFKFTRAGSVTMEAYPLPAPRSGQHRVLFSVADTGYGIPADILDALFEPFTQASEGFARKYQGAGLGLSICKRLAELMGGAISIDSDVGAGTTIHFCITFGLAGPPPLSPPAVEDKAEPLATGLRVLFVEDDEISRFTASQQLEKAGCAVKAVEDGRQALDALQQEDFDVVLMDVQMPVMDGMEATQAIRRGEAGKDKAGIPIIALTAYAMAGDREKFLEAGMEGYVAKPVDLEELVKVLARVTARGD